MENLKAANFGQFKISVVVTRHNVSQLDQFKALADHYGAQLRITRLRPAGRGADTWHELHPTNGQQREIYNWLLKHGENVLTGDSFFHLNAAGNVRDEGGFAKVWKQSDLFLSLREPQSAGACASCGAFDACQGGCMAAKFFTGLPLDGPDPECVGGDADEALSIIARGSEPKPSMDHSKPVTLTRKKLSVSASH
jgi:radical SAM protein with 4Fe4S-binding SPASM domain